MYTRFSQIISYRHGLRRQVTLFVYIILEKPICVNTLFSVFCVFFVAQKSPVRVVFSIKIGLLTLHKLYPLRLLSNTNFYYFMFLPQNTLFFPVHHENSSTNQCQRNNTLSPRNSCTFFQHNSWKDHTKDRIWEPKTLTRDTGLYFKRRPHTEYATAEIIARYSKSRNALLLCGWISPPMRDPTRTIIRPPKTNW